MVEVSPALRQLQWQALNCSPLPPPPPSPPPPTPPPSHSQSTTEPRSDLLTGTSSGGGSKTEAGGASSEQRVAGQSTERADVPRRGVSGFQGASVTWHSTFDEVPGGGEAELSAIATATDGPSMGGGSPSPLFGSIQKTLLSRLYRADSPRTRTPLLGACPAARMPFSPRVVPNGHSPSPVCGNTMFLRHVRHMARARAPLLGLPAGLQVPAVGSLMPSSPR